jgi:hypothetical protein
MSSNKFFSCFKKSTKRPKYNNVKVIRNGIAFDSKLEANTYLALKNLLPNNKFATQVPFKISSNLNRKYIADIVIEDQVVVEVKSKVTRTAIYKLKKALFTEVYKDNYKFIEVVEMNPLHIKKVVETVKKLN